MITINDILPLNFIKKEEFSGSYKGMRFVLRMEKVEEENKLRVYIWSEPLNFESTPEEEKYTTIFEFSTEGIEQAVKWMNDRYELVRYRE